ncbi:MAG TPA: hypothetical protein PKN13_04525 [Accumulibacter sp.]|nr:hypothetical protein [Accumulibacter sp.]HMW16583.1 hypothetical protein [Accumulibacter sp.]HNC17487.1 hypothetical protein [Accumulibacter sp.]HND79168.1 hypothetical protein [Accumulibacter sp.]HNE13743.1 hypothetical protein [Accumulibacter sp.]
MNEQINRGKYTLEFTQEAVRQVKAGRARTALDAAPRHPGKINT